MIKDSCLCGAQFEVDYGHDDAFARGSERDCYKDFLEAHKACRESALASKTNLDYDIEQDTKGFMERTLEAYHERK